MGNPSGFAAARRGAPAEAAPAPRGESRAARQRRPVTTSDVSIRDWDALFCAVKTRLRLSVGPRPTEMLQPQGREPAVQVTASVLECVAALDQLHDTLVHELERGEQLDLELFDARTLLAQLRGELAGTEAAARQARHLALHDGLTLLPNRSFFRMRLDHAVPGAIAEGRTLAVLYLDIDDFKAINDAHGHQIGDELLMIVAARLKRAVRAEDMVSRLGGDAFGCLLDGLPGPQQLALLVAKLQDAVTLPMVFGGQQISVRASVGVAACPAAGSGGELLLRHADAAMQRARRQRSGCATFDASVDGWATTVS